MVPPRLLTVLSRCLKTGKEKTRFRMKKNNICTTKISQTNASGSPVVFPPTQWGFSSSSVFLEMGTGCLRCSLRGYPWAVLEGKFRLIKEVLWKSWCYYGPNISSLECRQKYDLF